MIFKKVFNWVKNIFSLIGLFLLGFFVVKKTIALGEVRDKKNWQKIPGSKYKVAVFKNGKKEIIELPMNPKTLKQITVDEIEAIGLPDNYNEESFLNVTIKNNNPVNRRNYNTK